MKALATCFCALSHCILLGLHGGADAASAVAPLPFGTGAGASRQAWAAAAALSRGLRLRRGSADIPEWPDLEKWANGLERAGFRSVAVLLPNGGASSANETQRVDALIDLLLARGLTVVLGLRLELPAGGRPPASELANRYSTVWTAVARRYANRSPRLLFEIYLPVELPPAGKNAVLLHCLKSVRASNPGRVVVVGWQDAISLPSLVLPNDAHLMVDIRNPEPFRFTRQGLPGIAESGTWVGSRCCTPREKQLMTLPLDLAKKWSLEHRYPVWLGEFGSYRPIPADLRARHAGLIRDEAEARGFSWAYGDSTADFGIYDMDWHKWQVPLLKALLGPR